LKVYWLCIEQLLVVNLPVKHIIILTYSYYTDLSGDNYEQNWYHIIKKSTPQKLIPVGDSEYSKLRSTEALANLRVEHSLITLIL